ncbi:MAG: hypothetical protein MK135_11095, partial [Polyangiaceae bacterium]|nr:hypothetical protein [Polyangiaceae bacterium]
RTRREGSWSAPKVLALDGNRRSSKEVQFAVDPVTGEGGLLWLDAVNTLNFQPNLVRYGAGEWGYPELIEARSVADLQSGLLKSGELLIISATAQGTLQWLR